MNQPFLIVYEDKSIVVINKIAKILTHSYVDKKLDLTKLLQNHLKTLVYPCHRLDRETTGLVIYAKSKKIQSFLMNEFKNKQVKKKYIAFVNGRLAKKEGVLAGYIIDREGKLFDEKPKFAKTFYKVIKEYEHFSVVKLEPVTGRTNQLRIQLAKIGNPILGDRKYARGKDFYVKFRRVALHAYFLGFRHPQTNKFLEFKIDLAKDMKEFLESNFSNFINLD